MRHQSYVTQDADRGFLVAKIGKRRRAKGEGVYFFLLIVAFIFVTVGLASAIDDASMIANKRLELEQKESELKKKEERLLVLEKTLDGKIREYQKLVKKAEVYLKEIKVIRDEDMVHLIKTYEAMPAEAAAGRIAKLETSLAVKVLRGMKTRSLGKVMAQLNPSRAAKLSKLMVAR